MEASSYDEQQAEKLAKKLKKETEAAERAATLAERRERKLKQIQIAKRT